MDAYRTALLEVRATLENPAIEHVGARACAALRIIDIALNGARLELYTGLRASYESRLTDIKRATGTPLARMYVADLALRIEHIDGDNELNIAGEALNLPRPLGQLFVNYQGALLAYVRSMM